MSERPTIFLEIRDLANREIQSKDSKIFLGKSPRFLSLGIFLTKMSREKAGFVVAEFSKLTHINPYSLECIKMEEHSLHLEGPANNEDTISKAWEKALKRMETRVKGILKTEYQLPVEEDEGVNKIEHTPEAAIQRYHRVEIVKQQYGVEFNINDLLRLLQTRKIRRN